MEKQSSRLKTGMLLMTQAAIGSLVVGYFAYHAVQGDSGFRAMVGLQTEVDKLAAEHQALVDERARWEQRAQQLRDDSIDPDMLEQQVRQVLQFTRENEYVVMTGPSE
ncbi:MAG: septum formation initiator family protein [Pseudomonadota bacterium]